MLLEVSAVGQLRGSAYHGLRQSFDFEGVSEREKMGGRGEELQR
jgi:hypothetical protein